MKHRPPLIYTCDVCGKQHTTYYEEPVTPGWMVITKFLPAINGTTTYHVCSAACAETIINREEDR